jgi:hypothetical protein
VLAGVAVAAGLIVFSSLRYPGIFQLPGSGLVLALTLAMLLGYAACGVWALRRPVPAFQTGLIWGLAGGVMWSAEIWCGGPAKLGHPAERALGATFLLLAVAATLTAGVLVSARTRQADLAWRAGLLSGLASGVLVYAFAVIMTLCTLPVLATRSDYQAQFAHSHAPSMAAFLTGDILAAVAAHLAINLLLGLAGGGIGVLVTRLAPGTARPTGSLPGQDPA